MPLDEASERRYARKSAFLEFFEKAGLSVLTGVGSDDFKTAPLKFRERFGSPAAYCHRKVPKGSSACVSATFRREKPQTISSYV